MAKSKKQIEKENQESINLNKTEKESDVNKKGNLSKTIVFTCLKTLLCLFVSVIFIFTAIFCLSPKTALKINEVFGFKGVETACYERIYLQSKKNSDLYNLIEKAISNKDYAKVVKYVDQMQNKEDYASFCAQVNTAAVQKANIKYVAYVGDYDSYLAEQKVVALYKQNKKDKAFEFATKNLAESTNKYSVPLASYVDLLSKEKSFDLSSLMSTAVSEKTIETLIAEKIDALDYAGKTDKEKVMCIYALLKIENMKHTYYESVNDQTNASSSAQRIADLQAEYNAIVNG